ncbi:MAG: motility protein A [Thermotogae bacterium]|nr:MAG: motility protein A [Thermotogota bacterium]
MDISTLLGLVLVVFVVIFGVGSFQDLMRDFVQFSSIMITVVGTIAAVMIAHPKARSFALINIALSTLKEPKIDMIGTLRTLVSFAEKARREGLLSLESNVEEIEDEFLKKGLQLVIDGTDPDLLKNMMEVELELMEEDFRGRRAVMDSVGAFAPAFGLIGTLIGLIQMLKALNNPDMLGPAMAKSLLTTLYGSMIANAVALPMGEKIAGRASKVLMQKRMILEGLLSIQAGDNPRLVEEKLKSFLSENEKATYAASTAVEEAA